MCAMLVTLIDMNLLYIHNIGILSQGHVHNLVKLKDYLLVVGVTCCSGLMKINKLVVKML